MANKAASSPRPLASPAAPSASVARSSPSLLGLAPTSSSSIILYLAALVSAGILIRTLHPRFRYRLAANSSNKGKRRDTVIKKIIAQQEATHLDSPADRTTKPASGAPARSRSSTLTAAGRERSLSSACVATTSAAIVSGLSKISTVATGAIASTSSAKLDPPVAIGNPGAKPGSAGPLRDGKGAPASSGGGSEDAFSSGVGRLLSVEQGGKKGKGKKGKGVTSSSHASSHASSLAATPSASPARRPSMRSSSVEPELLPTFEVSTQTAFTPPRMERTATSTSSPTPTAAHPQFDLPPSELNSGSHPPPSTPPKPPPIPSADATVQTSPHLAARPIPPPSLPRPFDLHASFQSTPPLRAPSQPPAAYPVPSPPPSPSPSRRLSPLPASSSPRISNRPTPSPTDLLSSSSTTNSPSPSPASSRSRKQARKASAAAAGGVSAQQTIVVGMPRPARSRDPTDELEMNGGDGGGSPKLLRVDTSSSRLSQSLEKSTVGLPSADKGKGREKEQGPDSRAINGTAMGSGEGRYGIPAPIPIPPAPPGPTRAPSDQRRLSTSTTGTGSGASAGSSSASPYLSHSILMTMTPPDAGRRTSVASAKGSLKHEEAFWRGDEGAGEKWDPGMMGLAIELNENERRRSREDGSVDGQRAGSVEGIRGNETARSWSSTGGSSSPNVQSVSDGYFPPGAHTAMTSPESSPHPPSRQLLPLSSTSNQRPWSPQLMAQQYTMIPYPVSGSGSASTPQQPPPLPHTHSSGGGQNSHPRPASRQTSLSVPPNTAQQQQAAHLQQQQAYAFYAHAQAQYQHVIALQLQAQQHHQRQVAQHQQQQHQQQQRQRHDSEHSNHSLSNGQPKPPLTPNGLVYPISGTHIAPPQTPQSLAQAQAQAQGWSTLPGSPGFPPSSTANGPYGIGSSISPTSATFPSSASSSSYSHIHQLPQVQQANSNAAYYLGSPTAGYLNNYSMSPQMPQLGQRQPSSSGKRGSGGGRNNAGGGDGEKLKSPRPGADRVRSASAAAITTMSSATFGSNGIVQDMAGWKSKARSAEMDADRSAKELEIARWRLAVLEEEQRTIELENQEALRALATRAMRAEARIKLLEETRVHDSSSASGSGSPATRPSSIAGSNEMPAEMLPPPISFDENDSSARDSPPGVKVHPLAWLDLDTVSFNVRPPSNTARPAFNSTPSGRRKGGRASGEFKNNRRTNTRRRSSNGGNGSFGTPPGPPVEDEEEEEVLILLDSPLRRKSIPHTNPVSRRSSFLGDDFSFEQHETSSNLDEDELSNLDFDEAESRSARGEPTGTSEYIGFLPTFLKPGNTSRPPSVAGSASPHLGPLSVVEDLVGEEAAAGEEEEEEEHESEMSDAVECGGGDESDLPEDGLQIRVNGFSPTIDPDVSLPSFILDTATPDLSEEERTAILPLRPPSPAPSPPPMSVASSEYSSATLSVNGSEERTPRVAPPPSPPVGGEKEEEQEEKVTPGAVADVEGVEQEQAAEVLAPENKDDDKVIC